MLRLRSTFATRKKLFLIATGYSTAAVAIVFGATSATPIRAYSQSHSPAAAASVFEFSVASIKPGKSWEEGWRLSNTYDGLTGKNVPLLYLIQAAYGIYEKDRTVGAPAWASSEFYNIEAKMDTSTTDAFHKLTKEQRSLAFQQMLQSLMADRFKLVVHHETRDLPVYLLVVAKGRPKLQDAKPDSNGENGPHLGSGTVEGGEKTTLVAQQMTMDVFARILTRPSGRTVLDKTGLTGKYEFTLQFAPDLTATDSNIPSLFAALQEQLGLKLMSGKGPVEIVVIDHVERPSGN
jgi:uncharacterized protein (TIGR03435 family)